MTSTHDILDDMSDDLQASLQDDDMAVLLKDLETEELDWSIDDMIHDWADEPARPLDPNTTYASVARGKSIDTEMPSQDEETKKDEEPRTVVL